MTNHPPSVLNRLPPAVIGETVLIFAKVYDSTGVTPATPSSVVCTITQLNSQTIVENGSAGVAALGTAQFLWDTAGIETGPYYIELIIELSGGNTISETYYCFVNPSPISFTTDLDTEVGLIRAMLGDDTLGRGVRPDQDNFSDDLITKLLSVEGSRHRALAALCEIASRQWSSVASITVGSRSEQYAQISANWKARASELRDQYGFGDENESIQTGVIQLGFAETATDE